MKSHLPITPSAQSSDSVLNDFHQIKNGDVLRVSRRCTIRQGTQNIHFVGDSGFFRRHIEIPHPKNEGRLVLTQLGFWFISSERSFEFPWQDILSVTTNSHYLEFKAAGKLFYQISFREESPLKYEILFQKILTEYYRDKNLTIIEFQPRIRFHEPDCRIQKVDLKFETPAHRNWSRRAAIFFFRLVVRCFISFLGKPKIRGKENIPREYPFIAIANHQSIFDPFIIGAYVDGRIGFLTKSTSFARGAARWFLRIARGIPTTRYQTDPLVFRHVLRLVQKGIPVGIFPEGERCWDGELQSLKYGVIRLLTWLGLPVTVIVMKNAFNFFPRWESRPHRQQIEVIVQAPFCLLDRLYTCGELRQFLEERFTRALEIRDNDQ